MSRNILLRSSRTFRIWDYFVSHSQLLVRSPKLNDDDFHIDIIFSGVEYVSLPALYGMEPEIFLYEGDNSDFDRISSVFSRQFDDTRIFLFDASNKEFVVVAQHIKIRETRLDYLASGLGREEFLKKIDIVDF